MCCVSASGGFVMGQVFSKQGTDKQRCTLERKNVQRVFFVALFMTVLSFSCVLLLRGKEGVSFPDKFWVACVFYGVVSVAFSCLAFQLLKRKSKKSELWLFQMIYLIVNTSFLSYLSFSFWECTGSFAVYGFCVLINSCGLLYNKGEYGLCFGIECLMPVVLFTEKAVLPQQILFVGAIHLLGAIVAIELYRGHKQAEEYRRKYVQEVKAAEMDPLTKVNNRRGMMRKVVSVWPALEQSKRSVAVMVIDIDHFKKYNDRFGHPGGDACLCRVADTVRSTVKGFPALVSRIGGEEFLVFLHGMEGETVYELAEQIRTNVEKLGMPHAEEAKYRYVTVSIGVVTDRCSSEISFGGLYRRADKELYRAKNSGRNRVSYHSAEFLTRMERKVNIR